MKSIQISANAKINLYLEVTGKRQDGYHNLDSIMHSVSLSDSITVKLTDTNDIQIRMSDSSIPSDSRNIAYKAAQLFLDKMNSRQGVQIDIQKMIPSEAGLGGGSSDAAAVLKAMNKLLDCNIPEIELAQWGSLLGADVPFCVLGGCAVARGIGEILKPLHAIENVPVVIARKGQGVSTPLAYRWLDDLDEKTSFFSNIQSKNDAIEQFEKDIQEVNIPQITKELFNRFEDVVLPVRDSVRWIKNELIEGGASCALMTGSGTAVFALCKSFDMAENLAHTLRMNGAFAYAGYTTK